jgi:ribosomal protein S18 acetylase RimI-like enzyme
MGLVPESRGMGRGRMLVHKAFEAAGDVGADRVILAVDRQNAPARAIYELAGLQPMLHETVWVKSLSRAN